MRFLLDTNAYTALMRGSNSVSDRVRQATEILLSVVVAGELLYGFHNGTRFAENHNDLQTFLSNSFVTLLPVTIITADRFGRISTALKTKGRPIPTNDVWIAAHTMETGAELLSFDRHFSNVDGLAWSLLSD